MASLNELRRTIPSSASVSILYPYHHYHILDPVVLAPAPRVEQSWRAVSVDLFLPEDTIFSLPGD